VFFHFWILSKYAFSWRRFFDTTTVLTVSGITVGVAVLVVAMSSFSGFETTLKRAIIEVSGDVQIFKRGAKIDDPANLLKQIAPYQKDVEETMFFLSQESLVAKNGKLSTVLLQGIQKEKIARVLNISDRIVEGRASWEPRQIDGESVPPAFLGKDLMKKLDIKIGDTFKVVLPQASKSSSTDLKPIIRTFYAVAALDLGKYEFNSRFLFTDLPIVQQMLNTRNISGIRYKLRDSDRAPAWASSVQQAIGWNYAAVDWRQTNKNYLSAIEYEKMVMFFVVLIIVIAASFNVATTLFVTVLKRYRDISLLKTLGARPRDVIIIFCLHGLFLGALGLAAGIAVGMVMCWAFELAQKVFPLLPSDVYRLSFVATEIRAMDLAMIGVATLGLSFLATLIPSIRGSMLPPVEGLKYE